MIYIGIGTHKNSESDHHFFNDNSGRGVVVSVHIFYVDNMS